MTLLPSISKEIIPLFTCPRCNTQLPNGTRFCPNCGLQFDQPVPIPGQPVQPGQFQPGQQAPGGQFQPAMPPKKKRNPFVIGCLGLFGFFVVIGVIGNLANGGKGTGSNTIPPTTSSSPTSSTPSPSSSDDSSSSSSSEPAAIAVSANQLSSAYNANEVSADDKYKDKVLEVTGTVDSIGKDFTDTSYVTLQASGDILGVQCMFDDQYKSQLSKLQKGQRIRLRGTCKGKTLNVLLADCSPD